MVGCGPLFNGEDAPTPMDSISTEAPVSATSPHAQISSFPSHSSSQDDLLGNATDNDDDDDDVAVNVGDLGDVGDLDEDNDDNDDLQRAHYASLPGNDDDDSDLLHDDLSDDTNNNHDPQYTHRQRLGSALAQLPQPKDNDNDDNDGGFDFFYDSPSSSASTALVVASSSVAPLIGPVPKPGGGAYAGNNYKRVATRNAFTGLSNQGATCYMNSLLQTMFMTPELRLGLYRWTFTDENDENDEDNIPFQLQKLFAKLQLSTQEAISTKALTKSFGWTGADVFQQHDVQELNRVLFDALEKSFRGTVNETLVNDLYQGTMKDYVQCRTCGYESSRQDEFLDLSLVIRPFGSTKMMKSVEEAIEFFLKPEVLNGDNQWMCDRCQTKRDAIKGLKFSKLPYLLSLQLKRFDYDYMTDSRVKLHDLVSFPKYLDMNSYLHEEGGGARGKIARKMSMERHELEGRGDPATARTRRMSSMDETQPVVAFADDDGALPTGGLSVADTWSSGFDVDALIEKTGPYVYELYSVLIHSGSALGGHYYAFIKSFEKDAWYDFNDSTVTELSENEVKKAWGGNGSNSYGGRISYSTCAYMLMYRLVSQEKNVNVAPKESIPQYLVDRMNDEEERLRRQELERIELSKKMLLKFYMKTNTKNKIEKSLHVYKTATLKEALAIAHEAFEKDLQAAMPSIENTRIRMYSDYTGVVTDSYEGREDKTLQQLQMYSSYQLYLEVKKDDEEWEPYEASKLSLYVRRFNDPETQDAAAISTTPDLSARYMQIHEESTIESFLEVIAARFDVPVGKKIRLLRKAGTSYTSTPVKVFNKDEVPATLKMRLRNDLHLVNGTEVYFEECDDLSAPSVAEEHFEREVNMIELSVWYQERLAETVRIDRRESVRTLKGKIAAALGLSVDKFKILRGNHRAGIEIKTIDTTLFALSIGQGSAVYALEGTPLSTGEYLFRLMLLTPAKASAASVAQPTLAGDDEPTLTVSNGKNDEEKDLFDIDEVQIRTNREESELEVVGSIKVGEEMLVDDIRELAWTTLKEKGKLPEDGSITRAHIRLRDVQSTTLMRILVDGHTLRKASTAPVYEGRGLVAEIRSEPEHIEAGHHLMHVVYVDRSKWRFCKRRRFELIVPKDYVGDDPSTDDEDDDPAFMDSSSLAIATVGGRSSKSAFSKPPATWIADQIALRLTIPPEQARFAVFAIDRDNFDIGEIFKTTFDTWDRCMADLRDRQHNYQLLVFVADADEPMSSFSARERASISDFLLRKRDEMSKAASDRSYANYSSNYRKPKEAALVIRTKSSKSGEKKSGSTTSSTGQSASNGVSIRTPTTRDPSKTVAASSDTDEEDDDDNNVNLYD